MTTEQLLFCLVAVLSVSTAALVWVTSLRVTGTAKLELDLGAEPLARALRERDQARALAGTLRAELEGVTPPVTVTSPVTQKFVTVAPNPEAKVTVTLADGQSFEVAQENDPEFLAKLQDKFQQQENARVARRVQHSQTSHTKP